MARLPLTRQPISSLAFYAPVMLLSFMVGATTLIWKTPLTPFLAGAAVIAAILLLHLLQRPLVAFYLALFLCLMPFKFGFDPVYDMIRNLALALSLGSWLLHVASRRRAIAWNVTCSLIVLYMIWACITILWAPDLINSRQKLVAYAMGLILLVVTHNQIRSEREIDGMMRVFAVIGWIMVIGGIYTIASVGIQFGERLKVLDVNENMFGTMLILMLPGVIWPALRKAERFHGFHMQLSIIYILCTIVLIALSGSRGSAISLVLVLVAFWFWKPLRPWGFVGIGVVAVMLISAPFVLGTLLSRFESGEGGDLGGRLNMWQASILLIQDHPWSGAGVGNGPEQLNWYVQSLGSFQDPKRILPSHNPFLEAGVETGVPGIAIYTAVLASALWSFFRFSTRRSMRLGILAAYFPLILGTSAGYLATWSKGGGMEVNLSYFTLLALLLIPAGLSPNRNSTPSAYDGKTIPSIQ
jgi:O-antigen ligase